jgi:hypothetical protein
MIDPYQGDPKLILSENGATMRFSGGQPVMDQGLENFVLISLFSGPGWVGNFFIRNQSEKIGSDFEDKALGTRTLSSLRLVQDAGEKALTNTLFEDVQVTVINPQNNFLQADFLLKPPNQDEQKLKLTRNSANWINQSKDPAYLRT